MSRPLALIALALACLVSAVPLSTATFSATTQSLGVVRSSVDWTPPTVALADPGLHLASTVTLAADASDGGTGIAEVIIQVAATGSSQWSDVCSDITAPFSCELVTTALAEGSYDLRAVATDHEANRATSDVVAARIIDRTPPTVVLEPLPQLRGTVTLTATATDGLSGVASVSVEVLGAGGWTTACTSASSTSPYTCTWDTTSVSNGNHSLRAVASDRAGNSGASSTRSGTADNAAASVSVQDPGTPLRGIVTVAIDATPTPGSTVSSVRLQRAPSGTSTWADVCTDTSAPFTCAWSTALVTDGPYDLRAIMLDSAGTSMTSAVVSQRHVDNTPPRGVDVQAVNGTGTPGEVDAGDTITFSFSEPLELGSVHAGWTGTEREVAIRLQDGKVVGRAATEDAIDVVTTTDLNNASPVHLGQVNLKGDFVKDDKVLTFHATMVASVAAGGGHVVTLTIHGAPVGGNGLLKTSTTAPAMLWTPSATSTDLAGNPTTTTQVAESAATGSAADKDF